MEVKKTEKANLERTKVSSFLMGLVVGLAVLFVGFEWANTGVEKASIQGVADVKAEEEIEITRPEDTPPPPPPPAAPVVTDVLNVVEDNVKIADVDLATSEDNSRTAQVATYVAPAASSSEEEEEDKQPIFTVVEQMPEFPDGGNEGLLKWIFNHLKYPVIAQENGIQGRVTVQFTVNRDGSVVDVSVMRGVDPSLDKEAVRVVKMLPKFKPGMQRGKPVRVRYTVPVTFKLQ
ncbi:MAG: TonB family protein [Tannerella sp.]|jgi:protein TonB|nr:TonB family protein [Tannerella sp.]